MNKLACIAVSAVMTIGFGWLAGPYLKGMAPNVLGYDSLGWVRGGAGTNFGISTPRWHGWQGVRAALGAPFNHHKIWLDEGQTLEISFDVEASRGGIYFSIYRTNLNTVLQGVLVEDHQGYRLRAGSHSGVKTYTAQRSGWYKIGYDLLWERATREEIQANPYTVVVPDYHVRYDIRWRLQDEEYIDFGSIRSQRLPHGS